MGWAASHDTRDASQPAVRHQGGGDRLCRRKGATYTVTADRNGTAETQKYADNFRFDRVDDG